MLKPPYKNYARIYTYHINGTGFSDVDDPDLIGIWVEDGKTILIFHKPKDNLIAELCRKNNYELFYQADLDYTDWEMGSEIVPFSVGPLTIAPVWNSAAADIKIDPSVVFGNGFHPSTRLCLESLVLCHKKLGSGFTGLDLGCGTGLLGIGAAKLGASRIEAVDFNPLACKVAKQNTIYNKVAEKVRVRQIDLRKELPVTKVDVIMANLHHELLIELFNNPSFWQARLYILSGFMLHGEEQLLTALPDSPPPFLDRGAQDKWRVWVLGEL